ncbi:MAG: hypothetical protein QOE14_2166 [Humisphaera sp.]|nr:hypothetical protein [Humisphaera sp.]
MAEPLQVTGDRRCYCGYNLRGLLLTGRCPECGRPVAESVRYLIRDRPKSSEEEMALLRRNGMFHDVAEGTIYPQAAVALVYRAFSFVRMRSDKPSASAADICDALRDYARYSLGGPAAATLKLAEWNIRRSEDVGAIVFRLVDLKIMRAEPDDGPEKFAGLFTLETLYDGEIGTPESDPLEEISLPQLRPMSWLWQRLRGMLLSRLHKAPRRPN